MGVPVSARHSQFDIYIAFLLKLSGFVWEKKLVVIVSSSRLLLILFLYDNLEVSGVVHTKPRGVFVFLPNVLRRMKSFFD